MIGSGAQSGSFFYRLKVLCLNLTFYALVPVVTLGCVAGATLAAACFRIFAGKRSTLRLVRRSISNYGLAIIRCAWPLVKVRYVDLAPDEKPPFVFVCNHRSMSDGYLMALLPFECVQVQNIWPTKIPIYGMVAKLAGYLSVRQMPFEEFDRRGAALLAEGCSIIAFPEGTRSGSTTMGQFHGAAFRLAQMHGAKIVPLAVTGNEKIPPKGSLLLHPGRIVVAKLPAITPEQYASMTPFKLKTTVREMLQQHIAGQLV